MNMVNLVGRLSRDPSVTFYKSDIAKGIPEDKCRFICFFEVGVDRPSEEMGKDLQPIDWIPVTFFHGSKARAFENQNDLKKLFLPLAPS